MTDDGLAGEIGQKMRRLAKPGSHIFLFDWIYDGGQEGYKAVNRARLARIFTLDDELQLVTPKRARLSLLSAGSCPDMFHSSASSFKRCRW